MLLLHFSPHNKHNGAVLGCIGNGTRMDDNPNQPCHGAHVQCLGYRGSSRGHAVQVRWHRHRCCLLSGLGHASKRVSRTSPCLVPLPSDTWGSHASVVNRGAPQLVLCQPSRHAHAYSHCSPSPRHKQDPATTGN